MTYKTTFPNRFPKTISFLENLQSHYKVIHDIGCSDGTSSLSLIKRLSFETFFCLDKYMKLDIIQSGSNFFLLDLDRNIHIYENKLFYVYLDPLKDQKNLFEKLLSRFLILKPKLEHTCDRISLVNNDLKKIRNVFFKPFDLFTDNLEVKSDLIFIFNLLNKFNDEEHIEKVKLFAKNNLKGNGIMVIGENQPNERASIYRANRQIEKIAVINGGSAVEL